MMRLLGSLLSAVALSLLLSVPARGGADDGCSVLAVTSETEAGVTTHTLGVEGALPDVIAYAAMSFAAGQTVYDFGSLGVVSFSLDFPIYLIPMGVTDAAGAIEASFALPSDAPLGWDVVLQATTFGLDLTSGGPAIVSCLSDPVAASF